MSWRNSLSNLRKLVSRRPEKDSEPVEAEVPLYSVPRFSSALWDLSHLLAVITGFIFSAVLLIFAFGRSWHLRERIDAVLPDKWFRSLADSDVPQRVEQLKKEAAQELHKRETATRSREARPTAFGLGSKKAEVVAIQGKPDEAGDNTWRYGESEVYFASDRVIGWRVSASTPLKVH